MSTASSWQCMMKQTLKFKNKFKHILKIEFLKSPWSLRKQTNKDLYWEKKMCSATCLPHFLLWKKGAGIKLMIEYFGEKRKVLRKCWVI